MTREPLQELAVHLRRMQLRTTIRRPDDGPSELDVADGLGRTVTIWCDEYDGRQIYTVWSTRFGRQPLGWISDPRSAALRTARLLERDA